MSILDYFKPDPIKLVTIHKYNKNRILSIYRWWVVKYDDKEQAFDSEQEAKLFYKLIK